MQVHQVMTRKQWEALQPKPEPDRYDCWMPALTDHQKLELAKLDPSLHDLQRQLWTLERDDISRHCLVGEPGHPCG